MNKIKIAGIILVALSALLAAAKAIVQFISCIGKMKHLAAETARYLPQVAKNA